MGKVFFVSLSVCNVLWVCSDKGLPDCILAQALIELQCLFIQTPVSNVASLFPQRGTLGTRLINHVSLLSAITHGSCSRHTRAHAQLCAHNRTDFTFPFGPTCEEWCIDWRMMLLFKWQKIVFPQEDIIKALAGTCHTVSYKKWLRRVVLHQHAPTWVHF